MNFSILIVFINVVANIFVWIVVASALFSFFLSPYHPVRVALDRVVDPFLNPIRQVLPSAGMFDFSPLVLILVVEVVSRILISILIFLS